MPVSVSPFRPETPRACFGFRGRRFGRRSAALVPRGGECARLSRAGPAAPVDRAHDGLSASPRRHAVRRRRHHLGVPAEAGAARPAADGDAGRQRRAVRGQALPRTAVNDSFGHVAGDHVIEAFAGLLKDAAARGHIAGRLGAKSSPSSCPAPTWPLRVCSRKAHAVALYGAKKGGRDQVGTAAASLELEPPERATASDRG